MVADSERSNRRSPIADQAWLTPVLDGNKHPSTQLNYRNDSDGNSRIKIVNEKRQAFSFEVKHTHTHTHGRAGGKSAHSRTFYGIGYNRPTAVAWLFVLLLFVEWVAKIKNKNKICFLLGRINLWNIYRTASPAGSDNLEKIGFSYFDLNYFLLIFKTHFFFFVGFIVAVQRRKFNCRSDDGANCRLADGKERWRPGKTSQGRRFEDLPDRVIRKSLLSLGKWDAVVVVVVVVIVAVNFHWRVSRTARRRS